MCAGTAYFLISVLLPKASVEQGAAVTLSFGVSSLAFAASIPGKGFTGFLVEIIGRATYPQLLPHSKGHNFGISASPSWWSRARKPHGAPEGSFSVAGPIVRIHLPPAVSLRTIGSRNTRSSVTDYRGMD